MLGQGPAGLLPRLLRATRLLRLARGSQAERFVREHVRSDTVLVIESVVKAVVLMIAVAHLIACAWYAIGHEADGGDDSNVGWVRHHQLQGSALSDRYVWALHWTLGMFVGEQAFELHSVLERGFSMGVLLFCFLFSTIFVSTVTTSMTRLQIILASQSSKISDLRWYLSDNGISLPLAARVQRNAQHTLQASKRNVVEMDPALLSLISQPLQAELHFEVRFPILKTHPFFRLYLEIYGSGMRKICHLATSIVPISFGDVVFNDFEAPVRPSMFFVVRGAFTYQQDRQAPARLKRGDWACEPTLWTRWIHCGTLRAVSDCTLMSLDAERFAEIASPFPSNHASTYAEAFVESLNDSDGRVLTDLRTSEVEVGALAAFPEFITDAEGLWGAVNSQNSMRERIGRKASARVSVSMSTRAGERLRELFGSLRRNGRARRLRSTFGSSVDVGS